MTITFYVLKKTGTLLYSYHNIIGNSLTLKPSPLLVAGFFSAFEQFAREFVKNHIDTVEMGDIKLRFCFEDTVQCIFCLVYPKTKEDIKYKYLLNVLKQLFVYYFKGKMNEKIVNLAHYKNFNALIKLIFEAFEIKSDVVYIEHFTCGYTGLLQEFQTNDGLICPTCNSPLTSESIDYRLKLDGVICQ
ncbi:MAG: hypothetical protein ACTSRS_14740 [Candidatus Helarchaeota archaeon]